MTGWIIFGAIVLLLSIPLFIPLRLRVGLDEERRDWSVHVAVLQVAPEGERHWQEFRTRWGKRLKPLRIAGGWLLRGLLVLGSGLALAAQGVLWLGSTLLALLTWPFKWIRRRPRRQSTEPVQTAREELTPEEPEDEQEAASALSGEPVEETPPAPEPPEEPTSGEIRNEPPSSAFDSTVDDQPEAPSGTDLFEDLDDLDSGSEEMEADSEEVPGKKRGFFDTISLGFSMLELYGPLGQRILGITFGFVGDILRVPRWRRFEGHLSMGGDPAAMGALLGWQHAFMGAIDPRLHRHLHFEPDFDDPDRPVSGSLDFEVVIWPYRFVGPTLRLIVRIPWIGLIKVYRRYRAGTLIPAQNSGVA